MKKRIRIAVASMMLLFILPGCDVLDALRITPSPSASNAPTPIPTIITTPKPAPNQTLLDVEKQAQSAMGNYTDSTPVVFADSEVEAWIRSKYIKKTGDITVGDMKTITELIYELPSNMSFGSIKTLFDLRYCSNLRNLTVERQPITSVEGLRGLPNLRTLYLQMCDISDFSPLEGMGSLTDVAIGGNPCSDASPILRLPNLRFFTAAGTQISDISALRGTNSLVDFTFPTSKLSDISPLFSHKNLQSVTLTGLTSEDFAAMLDNLKNLRTIYIESSAIEQTALEQLRKLPLQDLHLPQCGIKDLSPFSSLLSLTYLGLYGNVIEDLSPLSKLTRLETLDLRYNKIKDYTPLRGMNNLKELLIEGNPVMDDITLDELYKKGCTIVR